MVDIPKQTSRGANIFNKALTSRNNPIKRLIILSYHKTTQKLRKKIRLMGSFNWI